MISPAPVPEVRSLSRGALAGLFLACLLFVTALNASLLTMPPIWDAAAGVFAPAIFLYQSGFDLAELTQQSGYLRGGPNVHSMSLITLVTYLAMVLGGGRPEIYLPALHAVQLLFAAVVLTVTFMFAFRKLGTEVAVTLTLATGLSPLFLVQSSYVYTEIPGAALVMLALASWSSRRHVWMVLLVALACLTKGFGVALVVTLVALVLLDRSLRPNERFRWGSLMVTALVAVEFVRWLAAPAPIPMVLDYQDYLATLVGYLRRVPDLFFLVFLTLVSPLLYLLGAGTTSPRLVLDTARRAIQGGAIQRGWVATGVLPLVFLALIVTVPLAGREFFPLPRYFVWSLPCMMLTLGYLVHALPALLPSRLISGHGARQLFTLTLFALTAVFFALNRHGALYSEQGFRSFSVAERSFEYLDFYRIQRAAGHCIEMQHDKRPVFATRGEFYFLSSPMMGYVRNSPRDLRFVLDEPYAAVDLVKFPDDFYVLDTHSNRFHGQHIVQRVLETARRQRGYTVEQLCQNRSGQYRSEVYRIRLAAFITDRPWVPRDLKGVELPADFLPLIANEAGASTLMARATGPTRPALVKTLPWRKYKLASANFRRAGDHLGGAK